MIKQTLYVIAYASLLLSAAPAVSEEWGDGVYDCQGGLTTAIKALDRKWTPIGSEPKSYQIEIFNQSQNARIEGLEYNCQTQFFEYLGCTTGFYHFTMNINNGRFTFDKSYGFVRGETPGGDAEIITTTLGFCQPATRG